jgi:hypothetical protein
MVSNRERYDPLLRVGKVRRGALRAEGASRNERLLWTPEAKIQTETPLPGGAARIDANREAVRCGYEARIASA